jgi:hypothetical protein
MGLFKERQQKKQNMTTRRIPPPWSVEETDACFIASNSGCADD